MSKKNLIAVISTNEAGEAQATDLAQKLQIPFLGKANPQPYSYLVAVKPSHIELQQTEQKTNPIKVDFLSGAMNYRRLHGGGKQQSVARATGVSSKYKPRIIDATAGLGNDAFALACLGCQVLMLERSPIIGVLLQDGLTRLKHDEAFKDIKLDMIIIDAIEYLENLSTNEQPDVIYLDPMFPERTKSALVKKEMRILRDIVGSDQDTSKLLAIALQRANKRVVVKRSRLAPTVDGPKPNLTLTGQSSRFDIYLITR